eukprot:jgi/Bigna1/75509/fgenesh1_pg.35_\
MTSDAEDGEDPSSPNETKSNDEYHNNNSSSSPNTVKENKCDSEAKEKASATRRHTWAGGYSKRRRYSTSDPEENIERENQNTLAAVQNIRTWLVRLENMQRGSSHFLGSNTEEEDSGLSTQVFLGGSCNPTTWRKDVVIPMLTEANISFYNPQVDEWSADLIEVEAKAKAGARILFFVIDKKTRATSSVLESVEYICSGRVVVLVIEMIPEGSKIDEKQIVGRELKDLNRGRAYLKNVADRHGVPVFETPREGVEHIVLQIKQEQKRNLNAPPAFSGSLSSSQLQHRRQQSQYKNVIGHVRTTTSSLVQHFVHLHSIQMVGGETKTSPTSLENEYVEWEKELPIRKEHTGHHQQSKAKSQSSQQMGSDSAKDTVDIANV